MARVTWKATVRETSGAVVHPSYTGEDVTREFVINFFGLNEPDVESYELDRIVE